MRALVFDFDGLILDTESPELEVWKEIFTENGVEWPVGYWATIIGRGAEQEVERPHELLERLAPGYRETAKTSSERRSRMLARIARQQVRPGITDLVDECLLRGLPYAIASSSRRTWIEGHLDRLKLLNRFPVIVGADEVELAKPFPDLYLQACRHLDCAPEDGLALEDSPNGITAAKAAGLAVVAVPNPATSSLDLSEADCAIESLKGVTVTQLETIWTEARAGRTAVSG